MSWKTPDNLALLKHLAGQGKSSAFIAWQIGFGCTRNCIIGHCRRHRIPLTGKRGGKRETKPETVAAKPQKQVNNNHWFAKRIPEKRKPPMEDPTLSDPQWSCPTSIPLMDAMAHHCRWPVASQRCCGENIVYRSYCGLHAKLSYVGMPAYG